MRYDIQKATEILKRTPSVLKAQLSGLSDEWLMGNEGPETFSPYDVIGHLVHGELTDWKARIDRILTEGNRKAFDLFDRFAMYTESKGKTIDDLLSEFEKLRNENLKWLSSLHLTNADLDKKGLHPKLGEVTLRNLLTTWVAHDLTHIAQINRVMAKQYKDDMGPWVEFFRVISF